MVKIAIPNFCINFLNKTVKLLPILYDFVVAPFVCAWIKTMLRLNTRISAMSHPSRVRGLKLPFLYWDKSCKNSRTPRGCVD